MSDSEDASSEPGDVPPETTLWHYSNEEISGVLTPRLGGRRHDGEDPRLAGKPAVWLATPRAGSADYAGEGIQIYEYEIVVPEGARVYKCRAHAAKVEQEAAAFNEYLRRQGKEPMKAEDFATHQYYGSLDPLPINTGESGTSTRRPTSMTNPPTKGMPPCRRKRMRYPKASSRRWRSSLDSTDLLTMNTSLSRCRLSR